jgi:CCR4-NOT transcriptional regulation complex NOT5 subunit
MNHSDQLNNIATALEESECDPVVIENICARIRRVAEEIDEEDIEP